MVAHVYQFVDGDVKTTLNQGGTLSSGATSFTLASASGFPSSGDFAVLFDKAGTPEVVKCTAISGTTVTCVATTASHADGVTVDLVVSAAMLKALWDAPYVRVIDTKSAGTNGGTFTSGSWQTRTLNSITDDPCSLASLSSNQI